MITRIIYPLFLREKISCRLQKFYSNLNGKNIQLELNKNLKFDLSKNDVGHQSIILNGFYELDLSKAILKLGTKGGLLIDVGANYGYFSCLWASQNPRNKVLSFEASPANLQPLENNINKNKLSHAINVIPIALGKEKGKLKFNLKNQSQQTGWGGFSIDNNLDLIEVDVISLDEYAAENSIAKIDVLKIDTEGADTWVLYGAEKLLKEKKINHIYFEKNLDRMQFLNINESEAQDFLEKLDYVVEKRSPTDFYAYPNQSVKLKK